MLLIAEVRSRYAAEQGGGSGGGGAEDRPPAPSGAGAREKAGIAQFVRQLRSLGFDLVRKDATSTMFVWFEFRKAARAVDEKGLARAQRVLKPCLYKKR